LNKQCYFAISLMKFTTSLKRVRTYVTARPGGLYSKTFYGRYFNVLERLHSGQAHKYETRMKTTYSDNVAGLLQNGDSYSCRKFYCTGSQSKRFLLTDGCSNKTFWGRILRFRCAGFRQTTLLQPLGNPTSPPD